MKTVKLSKKQIKAVKEWLEAVQGKAEFTCPFDDQGYWFCKKICWKLFSRVGPNTNFMCPCSKYSYSYIRRVAINLLKSQV